MSEPLLVKVVERRRHIVEHVLPYAALALSVFSLGLSVWQARRTINHDKLGVLPNLSCFLYMTEKDTTVGLELASSGLGPAIIKDVSVFLDNQRVEDIKTITKRPDVAPITKSRPLIWYSFWGRNTYMPVGDKHWMLSTTPDEIVDWPGFNKLIRERLRLMVQYCSVYQECWLDCIGGAEACRGVEEHKSVLYPDT